MVTLPLRTSVTPSTRSDRAGYQGFLNQARGEGAGAGEAPPSDKSD